MTASISEPAQPLTRAQPAADANQHVVRRANLLAEYGDFVRARLDADPRAKGHDVAFAQRLQIGKSALSELKSGSRPIGDRLARQIEAALGKPAGWLDALHEELPLTSAEQAFLDEALAAYRRTNAKGRAELRRLVRGHTPHGNTAPAAC